MKLDQEAQTLARLRLAHEAAMVDDAAQLLRLHRQATEAHERQTHGEHYESRDDEVIHIGDVNHPVERDSHAGKKRGPGRVALAALVTAAMAAGGLAGAAPFVLGLFNRLHRDPPATSTATDTDTDSVLELRLAKPAPID